LKEVQPVIGRSVNCRKISTGCPAWWGKLRKNRDTKRKKIRIGRTWSPPSAQRGVEVTSKRKKKEEGP